MAPKGLDRFTLQYEKPGLPVVFKPRQWKQVASKPVRDHLSLHCYVASLNLDRAHMTSFDGLVSLWVYSLRIEIVWYEANAAQETACSIENFFWQIPFVIQRKIIELLLRRTHQTIRSYTVGSYDVRVIDVSCLASNIEIFRPQEGHICLAIHTSKNTSEERTLVIFHVSGVLHED